MIQKTSTYIKKNWCPGPSVSMDIMLASSPWYILLVRKRVIQISVLASNATIHFTDGSIGRVATLKKKEM